MRRCSCSNPTPCRAVRGVSSTPCSRRVASAPWTPTWRRSMQHRCAKPRAWRPRSGHDCAPESARGDVAYSRSRDRQAASMTHTRRAFLASAAAAGALALLPRASRSAQPSLLLRDVRVIDGTGAPAQAADVLVRGDTIERIGRIESREAAGARIVEGGGRVLAPGFIDLHAHGEPLKQAYDSHLAMGATTVVVGQDGGSPGDGDAHAWLEAVQRTTPGINVATMTGHGSLRRLAGIDDGTRDPSDAQLE